jgi:hypothetical protein
MHPMQWALAGAVGLFLAMLACLEVGFRVGQRRSTLLPDLAHEGVSDVGVAVFALLGLLLAFSFAGGISRLDARRQMIVQEANAISSAYSRLDLLPADHQPEMRRLFREYLDTRLQTYEQGDEESAAVMARVAQLQQVIWSRAVAASRSDPSLKISLLLLPAINEMTDLTTMRMIAARTHLPELILGLMTVVALLSALVAGYTMSKRRKRSWFHAVIYAGVIAITFYVVLDLEYPRSGGFIGLESADLAMRQVRDSMR